jgi:hypothetical protein
MQSKTRVNFSFLAVLSLAVVFVSSSYGQTAKSGEFAPQKKLGQHQINRLIASAKTPEDHQRIAEYYEEQALNYENQARAYGAKIAAYERTPYMSSCAMCVTTSYSLEAAVRSLRTSKQWAEERADEMQKLAAVHEQISSTAHASDSRSGM